MVPSRGNDPLSLDYQSSALPLSYKGIELSTFLPGVGIAVG
jgi:hypothetical protein